MLPGVWGCSPIPLLFPREWRARGLRPHTETLAAGFASLYALYNWVPRPRRSVALLGPSGFPLARE
jgi:hypothetical protein